MKSIRGEFDTLDKVVIGVFLGLVIALCGLLAVQGSNNVCHGQCTHDRKCQERCLKANYCPYGEQ